MNIIRGNFYFSVFKLHGTSARKQSTKNLAGAGRNAVDTFRNEQKFACWLCPATKNSCDFHKVCSLKLNTKNKNIMTATFYFGKHRLLGHFRSCIKMCSET